MQSHSRAEKNLRRSTFTGVTGGLCRTQCLNQASFTLTSEMRCDCLNGTLTAWVFCSTFKAGVVILAARAMLRGLKGPASSPWKRGRSKVLTSLSLKFVCERLWPTKTIGSS